MNFYTMLAIFFVAIFGFTAVEKSMKDWRAVEELRLKVELEKQRTEQMKLLATGI